MPTRILLVDDHQMFREGLRSILERDPNLQVVAQCSDGRRAVELATTPRPPDVIVMDIAMAGLNGIEATRQILRQRPNAKIVALSAHTDRRFVAAMLEAGASAYVLKEAAGEEIIAAVQAAQAGRKFLSPAITGIVVESYVNPRPAKHKNGTGLGAREREIVQLLTEGKTSKDVGRALHISVKTVETHRRNIMRKLQLRSVASLTKFAIREGLTSVET